jgi:4-diphosphocytidyl-2-C-methyl-D-erythritol kinase
MQRRALHFQADRFFAAPGPHALAVAGETAMAADATWLRTVRDACARWTTVRAVTSLPQAALLANVRGSWQASAGRGEHLAARLDGARLTELRRARGSAPAGVPALDVPAVLQAVRQVAAAAWTADWQLLDLAGEEALATAGRRAWWRAALVGAARAWGIDWSRARLADLAARLGSDVPFFVEGVPAVVSGRGERLTPVVGMPALDAVIACPAPGLSTAAVYTHCTPDPTQRGAAERLAASFVNGDLPAALGGMHNTLEPPARGLCTEVGRLLAALAAAGAVRPMLTGSGSACFAIARTAPEARGIAARRDAAGWPGVFPVRFMPGRMGQMLTE